MVGACPFPTRQGSQVYIGGQARALAEAGVDLTLLTYGHGEGRIEAPYRHIRLSRPPGYGRLRSGPDRVKPFLDAALFARLLRLPAELYHAHNYEAGLVALAASRLTHVPVLYDAHGLLSEELPSYAEPRWHPLLREMGARADRVLSGANAVLAISRIGHAALQNLGAKNLHFSPPGVDPQDLEGVDPRHATVPTVVYAGNPDRYQDLPVLLHAMEQLPGVTLRIVSFSGDWDALLSSYSHLRIERILPRSWGEARDWIAGAHVAAIPRRRCPGFPIKLLDYLGLGVPTVVCSGSAQGLPGEVAVEPENFAAGLAGVLAAPPHDFQAQFLAENVWGVRVRNIIAIYRTTVSG